MTSNPVHRTGPLGRVVVGLATLLAAGAAGADAPPAPQTTLDIVNDAMGLDHSRLVRLAEATPEVPYEAAIEIDGHRYTLDLEPHSWRSPDYHVYHSDADGNLTEVEPGPVNTFRGTLLEAPGAVVSAGVLAGDGLYGRVSFADGDEVWFEPVVRHLGPGSEGLHVVYRAADVRPHDYTCGVEAAAQVEAMFADPGVEMANGGQSWRADLAADADRAYFSRWQNNTESRINSVIGTMNNQYDRDVSIIHRVSTIIIRTEQVYTTNDPNGLLDQFRLRWIATHRTIERDIAHLFTGRNLTGGTIGIAWLSVICDNPVSGRGYGLVQSDFSGNFACVTDLSAHELGHNWSAGHCSCSGFTMNPSITCANRFTAGSIASISRHRNSRNCLDMVPPNDMCADAVAIGDTSIAFSNIETTTDGNPLPESCDEGDGRFMRKDVWFLYAASCTGTATASICNADFNNRLAVYADTDCPGAALLSCNDFFCGVDGNRAEASFPVTAGAEYLIRIGGVLETGEGTLVTSCVEGAPCAEDFDGDGMVGFNDVIDLLANWGDCEPPCRWDLDADGVVGFDDLIQVLAAWGPCEG